ncbi:hypothetical protein HNP46_000435 [Pseudomonas nitritireducens]|uniref:Uncharacterized protein n=1 Tax=Pseudomonas nitroreducens TaxID=46680 RepID=A0A7W7KFZ8_PSENT|nr:hypothetical protein [Pseudomonas nitritireducens]MBB4861624.1 hypothetical protein [Pseudomonas nitritireducens]
MDTFWDIEVPAAALSVAVLMASLGAIDHIQELVYRSDINDALETTYGLWQNDAKVAVPPQGWQQDLTISRQADGSIRVSADSIYSCNQVMKAVSWRYPTVTYSDQRLNNGQQLGGIDFAIMCKQEGEHWAQIAPREPIARTKS